MSDTTDPNEPTPNRPTMGRRIAAIAVAALGVVALAASAESNEATRVEDGSASSSQSESSSGGGETFSVGDIVALGDWAVTVNSVTDPFVSPNEFDTPNGRYVAVDATVTNNGTSSETVSSLLCFELRDATGRTYNQSLVVGGGSPPDGEVDPGGLIRGDLHYDVPVDVTGLQLRFKCDLFSSGSAVINL